MKKQLGITLSLACMAACFSSYAFAATVPFTENFTATSAGWRDAASAPATYVGAGGPDGSSYASAPFSFVSNADGDTPVIFRGQDEFGFSGGNFIGNWNTEGVRKITAQVRHNAPMPLSYFTRLSSPFGFPGAIAVQFGVVLPNTWTQIEFDLTPTSLQFVSFEGSDWPSVFNNVGHVQFGAYVPAALAGNPASFTFDIDQVAISTPEPTSLLLGVMGSVLAFGQCRVRRSSRNNRNQK